MKKLILAQAAVALVLAACWSFAGLSACAASCTGALIAVGLNALVAYIVFFCASQQSGPRSMLLLCACEAFKLVMGAVLLLVVAIITHWPVFPMVFGMMAAYIAFSVLGVYQQMMRIRR